MNNTPYRFCFFPGPGVGKTVTAAKTFAELKIRGFAVELITEVIKEWAWLNIPPQSWDQYYIFGSQIRREDIVLRHKHTNIITDSPIWLQLAYMKRAKLPYYKACVEAAKVFDKDTNSLNFMLKRTVPYQQEGRYENPSQAIEMDELVRLTLAENDISWQEYDPVEDLQKITNDIVTHIERMH